MKLKIGNKMMMLREERRMNQEEMAEPLCMSTSAYARMERNETSPDVEQLVKYAEKLEVPIQDFLPDTVTLKNTDNTGQAGAGILFGNLHYYANPDQQTIDVANDNKALRNEISLLKDQINFLIK